MPTLLLYLYRYRTQNASNPATGSAGLYLGSESFRQEQLARMEGKLGPHHAGELRRETAEAKGGRIVAEELQRLGRSQSELMLR